MQKKIKNILRKFPFLFSVLRNFYRFFVSAPKSRREKIQEQIQQILKGRESVFFIQVGANDGVRGDPINQLITANENWTGIFVEPLTVYFKRLKNNYNNAERFIFENVAIAMQPGHETIYYVSEEAKSALGDELPDWFYGLGSFEKSHIFNHFPALGERISPYILEEEIEAVPLQVLLDRNGVTTIDVLSIDTEGFDYSVLSQVDFNRYKPSVILYEHKHLSSADKDRASELLNRHGYTCTIYGGDTLAILNSSVR